MEKPEATRNVFNAQMQTIAPTKTAWASNFDGIWREDDPTYFIEANRFNERQDEHMHGTNDLVEWLLHLRKKTYFDANSELSFIAAYLAMQFVRSSYKQVQN